MTTPVPYGGGVQTGYQGLGAYASREKVDPLAKRPDESQENWERRTAVHRRHSEDNAVPEDIWKAWRAIADGPTGQGAGLDGRTTPQERAQAIAGRFGRGGFGSGRELEMNGGVTAPVVPGQNARMPFISHAMVEQREREQRQAQQQPQQTTADLRSSGLGWFTR